MFRLSSELSVCRLSRALVDRLSRAWVGHLWDALVGRLSRALVGLPPHSQSGGLLSVLQL